MRLIFYLLLFSSVAAFAESTGTVTFKTPVYQRPNEESRVLFYIEPGESLILLAEAATDGFMPMRIIRAGKWRKGYVPEVALSGVVTNDRKAWTESKWAIGGGLNLTYLLQKSRSFETEDQVRYTTSDFSSTAYGAGLFVQYKEEDFWRFSLSYKLTNFKGTANTNVTGDTIKAVSMKHSMVSGLLEKVYTPFNGHRFYLGGGLEVSKAIAISIVLDSSVLPTTSQNLPVYIVGEGIVGNVWKVGRDYSLFAVARAGIIPNQAPPIFQYEIAIGLARLL